MEARFELFDHTADIGVRLWAPDLPALARVAVQSLYGAIGSLVTGGDARPERLEFSAGEPALLLRDLLAELLHLFEHRGRVLHEVRHVEFDERRICLAGESRVLDSAQSAVQHEIKAITYHELEVCQTEGGYQATYIVDV